MVYCDILCILWYTVIYCGVLWYTVIYCGVLWCTVVYCDILWYTVVYCDILWYILWYTVIYYDILWYTVIYCVYCDILWCTVVYCGIQGLTPHLHLESGSPYSSSGVDDTGVCPHQHSGDCSWEGNLGRAKIEDIQW